MSAATAIALLVGCTSVEPEEAADARSGTPPFTHVHGLGIDPVDGVLLVATHEGLIKVDGNGQTVGVGPAIDLMGFAVAGPDRFLASGHPGLGVDLPQPVGLIQSTDGGETWQPLSRQGRSDFHALTSWDAGVLGYDGSLVRSADGQRWEELDIPAEPHTLSASPDGQRILATTAQGVLRSTDAGSSWAPVDGAPTLQVVDWADDQVNAVGVDPSGRVWTSIDGALTWQEGTQLGAAPQAVMAGSSGNGALRITVVTAAGLVESRDSGRSFETILGQ